MLIVVGEGGDALFVMMHYLVDSINAAFEREKFENNFLLILKRLSIRLILNYCCIDLLIWVSVIIVFSGLDPICREDQCGLQLMML